LILANDAIKNLNWKNYQDMEDKRYFKPIALTVAIVCAFLISSVFEFFRLTFFPVNLDVPGLYYRVLYLIFSTIVRAFIFFVAERDY
jgi:hypothetical protein